jgi:predicted metal-dependent phosphoesterase TrpH
MELKLDLHIHSAHSPDGRMSLEEIIERCRKAGLDGAAVCDHDRVLTESPDFSDFLLIPGVELSTQYGHLLGLFVSSPIETKDFRQAVDAIHAQGGIAVLAHPFEHSVGAERLLPLLSLLDGMEVWNSRATRKNRLANAQADTFAAQHSLRPFAGSDAHVPQEIGNATLIIEAASKTPDAVKTALLTGNVRIEGRPSPACYTAASQLTRLKKSGASPIAYLKWVLFAGKCLLRDIFL